MIRFKCCTVLVAILVNFIGFENVSAQEKTEVSLSTEIKKLSDLSLLPQYADGSIVKQESSYDRSFGNDDGFDGTH
ncbi:MAG: hypothetical protein ACRDE7_12155, partial [Sphingobacterium sp.]